ncbi:hypothetical protein NDI76_04475 [Halogeometricum sp. S1BR25-6]|uniref:Uncharacterized protein n=1 Tax=Halogeometricum salsisoli TaxID=2950536 RepID=A0ABU2GB72_9EURY|nr:hypothetical protein [Halogeometricum sp. S1BR25-6]MDS0297989.1 hypothetical protein [Halogeometricum sp. S1BR25-6]
MAAKQSTFGIAHATVVPRNFNPESAAADGPDGDDSEAAAGGDEAA